MLGANLFSRILIVLLIVHFSLSLKYSDYSFEPCDFRDSVNITNGKQFSNGSYLHDGTLYPKKYIGIFDYYYVNVIEKISVRPYLRGCICKLKTCIQMCCENFEAYIPHLLRCEKPGDPVDRTVTITGTTANRTADIRSIFALVYGQPCVNSYFLEPLSYPDDQYELFENASIRLRYNDQILTRTEYCIAPSLEENQTIMYLNPVICSQEIDGTRSVVYGIALFLSIPFMILTFIVYTVIAELRNLHGKILCSYLFSLAFGYVCLGYIHMNGGITPGGLQCRFLGGLTYYLFMTAFFWLSANSFDLWRNFRVMSVRGTHNERRRFIFYSIFAWGLALLFLALVLILQNSSMPEEMKPGIGGGDRCFLNIETWMQLVYFYGPLLVTISFNTAVFVLTLQKIHQVNKEMNHMLSKGESRKNVNREKAKILLYLRLFIIMGVTWMMEFISWLSGPKYEFLFYATDICNAIQGLLIFIFFVLRKRVKKLLVQRYYTMRGIRRKDSSLNTTQTSKVSGVQMASTNYNGRDSEQESRKGEDPLMSEAENRESS